MKKEWLGSKWTHAFCSKKHSNGVSLTWNVLSDVPGCIACLKDYFLSQMKLCRPLDIWTNWWKNPFQYRWWLQQCAHFLSKLSESIIHKLIMTSHRWPHFLRVKSFNNNGPQMYHNLTPWQCIWLFSRTSFTVPSPPHVRKPLGTTCMSVTAACANLS